MPTPKLSKSHLKAILPFANGLEMLDIQALIMYDTTRNAAKATGRGKTSMLRTLYRVRARAAANGVAPGTAHNHVIPPGYHVKGVSELVGPDGRTKIKWIKSELNKEDLVRQWTEILESVCERVEGRAAPVPSPDIEDTAKDLCVIVPMGDPHVGLYTWAKEAETDFDCKIAEALMVGAVEHLVDVSPQAEEFILINLGDFFHSDNVNNRTAMSGNALDVDGRWAKVQEIGFWIMIRCIDRALAKYPKVTVHNAIGNHDEHTSQALAATLSAWYRNEPRVNVTRNSSLFWYTTWGKCMIGVHHGHTTKLDDFPLTMATHQPVMWGETLFRYCYLGHRHHTVKKEMPGVTVEQFRTLAPKDAWHWGNGRFLSMRDMQSITLHKQYGEVGRRICPVEYLERDCAKAA